MKEIDEQKDGTPCRICGKTKGVRFDDNSGMHLCSECEKEIITDEIGV